MALQHGPDLPSDLAFTSSLLVPHGSRLGMSGIASVQIPNAHGTIAAATDHESRHSLTPRYATLRRAVVLELQLTKTVALVSVFPILVKLQTQNAPCMSLQCAEQVSSRKRPYFDRSVA